jgi:type IV pilus assembly protein PilA
MKSMQKGFTLIELMIVVAIVGILASLAVPLYQDYSIRAKVSEASELISAAKLPIAEQSAAGTLSGATNSTQAGADLMNLALDTDISGEYVEKVTVLGTSASAATITVKFRPTTSKSGGTMPEQIKNLSFSWNALVNKGSITWSIGAYSIPKIYLPKS